MAFVISSGRLASTHQAPVPAIPAEIRLSDRVWMEYAELYRRQHQIRVVVGFLARNIAQLGIHVFRRVSDTDRERQTSHPLAELLARPLPGHKLSRFRLIERLVSDLAIYDNAVWVKVRPEGEGGRVRGLAPVPVHRVVPEGESWLGAENYRILGSRGDLVLPAEQVVHFHGYNPTDPRWGSSPMESLRSILAEEFEANRHRQQMWRNGARTSGFLERPADAPEWSPKARDRFREEFRAVYTGDGPDAGGVPILEDGMTFKEAGLDSRQAQYIEARKLTREEVAAAYFIPPPLVGILEHATFSNIREQHKQLYQDTLGPWLTALAEDLMLQLLPDLDTDGDAYVEFNIAEKLRGSFEEQAAAASTSTGRPWMTVNETRARNNLPAVDGGDELVVPLNVLVGGQASPRDSAPETSGEPKRAGPATKIGHTAVKARASSDVELQAARILERFFERQGRSVGSLLGAKRAAPSVKASAEDVDWSRWSTELTADLARIGALAAGDAGRRALEQMGLDADDYDENDLLAWIWENAEGQAEAVNETSRIQVQQALDDEDDPGEVLGEVLAAWTAHRAVQVAGMHTAHVSGQSTVVQARKHLGPGATKTWTTRSADPRPSHAALNGRTVALDAEFDNGAQWPGDSTLSAEERAHCRCELTITGPAPGEE